MLKKMPPPFPIREILDYNPDTGVLTWLHRPIEHFPDERAFKIWNTRYSGKVAGAIDSHGYSYIRISKKPFRSHRLAYLWMTGQFPKDQIDHINGIRSDNRWKNLRDATASQNQQNSSKMSNNTSGIKGVSWNRAARKWVVQVTANGKRVFTGYFTDFEKAKNTYCLEAKKYHGEFARNT